MTLEGNAYFEITTPLNVGVRITAQYWEYLITKKHRFMAGRESIVKDTLRSPDEIRQSRTDRDVFLYYKHADRLYCVVARHEGTAGFVITAYPTDKVKEGDAIWTK